jgi:hypothetical protein
MPYDITNTDGTLNYSVADNQVNTSQFSLALIGRNTANYGQYFAQNAIRHLENFAGVSSPTPGTKLIGQIWFDKGEDLLRVWDGTNWKRTGVVVASASSTGRPTEGEGAGTQFFNLDTNKLEVHNGTAFVEANFPGDVTTAYSSDATNGSPAHYGARLRTLFLKTDAGTTLPVLALVYTKSGSTGNVGTTTVNGQKETMMTLYSDHASFTIANPTATAVGSETINYYPELTGTGGIASARVGRAAGIILPGSNQRSEYEGSQTSNFATLYATAIGDASNPVSTQFVDSLTVNTLLSIPGAATVTGDLTVGGSIGLTGDLTTAATSRATFAELNITGIANIGTAGTPATLNVFGTLNLDGVNTQTLGTDAQKVETIFGDSIDTQNLTVDGTATIATLDVTTATVSSLATLTSATISGTTTMNGSVILGDNSADTITVNGTTTFAGGTTFNSNITLGSATNLTISNGSLILAGSSSITGASSKVLIDNQGSPTAARYLTFVNASTDDTQYELESDSGLVYIPQTNALTTSIITATGVLTFGSLSDGSIAITAFVDEDNMASNSASLLPTQQSVKAYVDTQVAGASSTATSINLTNEASSASDHYITFSSAATGYQELKTETGLKYIPSSNTIEASIFTGLASSAQYADMAEIYASDEDYEAGTVVKLGGSAEITQTESHADTDVFGVISTSPAYLMNKDAEGLAVALTGRVPVKVIGKIKKGERIVSSDVPGVAWALGEDEYDTRAIVGRALQDKDDGDSGIIEVAIGVK